jgi:hypothetical protein
MAELLQLFADPDRVRSSLHRNPRWSHIGEPLLDRLRGGPEATPIDYFSVMVEGAVMAPDVAKVDADRDLNLSLPAWDFSDEVLHWLLHGNSLSPVRKTCSSHFSIRTYANGYSRLLLDTMAGDHGGSPRIPSQGIGIQ